MRRKVIIFYSVLIVLLLMGIFLDKSIANFLAGHRTESLNAVMNIISYRTWIVAFAFIFGYLLLRKENTRRYLLPFGISLALSLGITYLLKFLVMRTRPEVALESASGFSSSFPSAHAAALFSIFAFLNFMYKRFPKMNWFWGVFSVLVIFSRIYLGMHYLSDVVAGTLIGYTISILTIKIKK